MKPSQIRNLQIIHVWWLSRQIISKVQSHMDLSCFSNERRIESVCLLVPALAGTQRQALAELPASQGPVTPRQCL